MSRLHSKLTYSNVIASVALFVALGGAAAAATNLPRNSVGPRQLKHGAVTAAKLRKAAVTANKLAPKAVVAGKIGAGAVLPGNLVDGGVNSNKIADGGVLARNIKNNVVTTNKLNNKAVTTQKLAASAVTTGKLADGSVTPAKLSENVAPLLGSLRTGQTLRGVFYVAGEATAGDLLSDSVSFQFPLLAKPAVTVLRKGETSADCSGLSGGNAETPQAAGGNLCVYLTEEANLAAGEEGLTVRNGTRLGFGLEAKANLSEKLVAAGQWAVTAP